MTDRLDRVEDLLLETATIVQINADIVQSMLSQRIEFEAMIIDLMAKQVASREELREQVLKTIELVSSQHADKEIVLRELSLLKQKLTNF